MIALSTTIGYVLFFQLSLIFGPITKTELHGYFFIHKHTAMNMAKHQQHCSKQGGDGDGNNIKQEREERKKGGQSCGRAAVSLGQTLLGQPKTTANAPAVCRLRHSLFARQPVSSFKNIFTGLLAGI